jgi:hypothetical protein
MFVLCYTVVWDISDMKDEKDLIQYKNGSKGKNPGQTKKKIPQETWMSVSCECCVLSGRSLCGRLITRSKESYRVWCV